MRRVKTTYCLKETMQVHYVWDTSTEFKSGALFRLTYFLKEFKSKRIIIKCVLLYITMSRVRWSRLTYNLKETNRALCTSGDITKWEMVEIWYKE